MDPALEKLLQRGWGGMKTSVTRARRMAIKCLEARTGTDASGLMIRCHLSWVLMAREAVRDGQSREATE